MGIRAFKAIMLGSEGIKIPQAEWIYSLQRHKEE